MERLKSYCAEVCFIDNLQTFIISPSKFDDILKDNELLMYLKKSDIVPFIKTSRAVGTNILYLAFVNLPAKVERFQWLPVHCYKNENKFYHVYL